MPKKILKGASSQVAIAAFALLAGSLNASAADAWNCRFSEAASETPTELREVLPSYVHACGSSAGSEVKMREGSDFTAFLSCGPDDSARIRLVSSDAPEVDAFVVAAEGDELTFRYAESDGAMVVSAMCSWGPSPMEIAQ